MTERRRRPGGASVSAAFVGGKRAVMEAVRAGSARSVIIAEGGKATDGLRDLLAAAERAGLVIDRRPASELDTRVADHRGVVAEVTVPATLSERDLATFPFADDAIVVLLDGVEDPQNLGAAARVADGAGAAMLVTRTRRSAPVTPAAIRASAGALVTLPHARVANIARALGRLKETGFAVLGLDEGAPVTIFQEPCPAGRVAIVAGSEGSGLARLVRESCDVLVALPMRGEVGSLNVATALAAVLYGSVLGSRV